MKIQPSVLVTAFSGKHSGGVLLKGKSGQVVRKKVRPFQPASNYNAVTRARLTSAQTLWSTLNAGQVAGWNSLAKQVKRSNIFGDKFEPSGINLFQMLNNNLLNSGNTTILDAPTLASVGLWTTFSATAVHGGAVSLVFAPSPVPTSNCVVIKATAAIPVGRQPKVSDFRQIAVIAAAQTTPYTATTVYTNKFSAVGTAGKVIYFRAYYINETTGQAGRPVQCSAVIS